MALCERRLSSRAIFLPHFPETQLGPDTGDLNMRFGLNSGPVTAGLLRGQQSRFQLFGDTVNTGKRRDVSLCSMYKTSLIINFKLTPVYPLTRFM